MANHTQQTVVVDGLALAKDVDALFRNTLTAYRARTGGRHR
jgi:hypothetical protein